MKKIFIATPMYGGNCTAQYMQSMIELQNLLISNGYQVGFSIIHNESLITRARNALVNQFLSTDSDFMLFIDADHRFNPPDILKMIEHDLNIICAIPPKKTIDWNSVKQAAEHGMESLEFFTGNFVIAMADMNQTIHPNKPFEILYGGTGIMLIKRSVFEKMSDSVKQYRSNNSKEDYALNNMIKEFFFTEIKDDILLSEDYAFCELWRNLGGKVYAAPWVGVTHIGSYEFSGSFLARFDIANKLNVRA